MMVRSLGMRLLHCAEMCVLCAVPAFAETNVELCVGTYNIRFASGDRGGANDWKLRRDDVAALIRRLDMDVFGMQEVEPDQMEFLRGVLAEYEIVGDHRNADRATGEASPVVYRKNRFSPVSGGTFWLSETPDEPGSRGWGAFNPRICTWVRLKDKLSDVEFCFMNAHPDSKSEHARNKGMELILMRMRDVSPKGLPIIFVGDHNCRETSDAALTVAMHLKNAMLASETTPIGPWRTFNGWRWRGEEILSKDALKTPVKIRNGGGEFYERCCGSRIDYIYVSKEVKVKYYATIAITRNGSMLYPSDHFPVMATLRFPCK